MKLQHTFRRVRTFLLIGLLSGGFAAHAAHSQRAQHGVVQTVDYTAKSFAIILGKGTNTMTFIWNDGTSFRQKSSKPGASWISRLFSLGEKTTAGSLQPGRSVWVYYRKEYGRLVTHWVTVSMPAPNPSTPRECAAQRAHPGPIHGLSFNGTVQSINLADQSLTVVPPKPSEPVIFAWNWNTKFWKNGIPIRSEAVDQEHPFKFISTW